jgi:hypothetical protein
MVPQGVTHSSFDSDAIMHRWRRGYQYPLLFWNVVSPFCGSEVAPASQPRDSRARRPAAVVGATIAVPAMRMV